MKNHTEVLIFHTAICAENVTNSPDPTRETAFAVFSCGSSNINVLGMEDIMANIISDETIEYVGILAKLELSDDEKEQAKKDMGSMLDYIDKLNELDTEGIEPMSHVFPVDNVFREDVVTNGDDREQMLANAPQKKEGTYMVPKTFD